MQSVVFVIGFPVVMYQPASAFWQDAQSVHGFCAAFVMHPVESQIAGAGHMQPVQFAIDPQPALIDVDDRGLDESAHNG